ncbi:MAG: DNA polymerase III subunit gamma/tau [SAR324 cluster bacterium]|nr:DNA polymerase III subunit gamma/tau [SAR324 cluster bacterium]
MSYVVLARKLRPSRFGDLIGQETAAQTLRNAVLSDRVAHAFLFTGSRGVGKTSAARILTRAVNCLNPDNGDPCNRCENCTEINQNASADVIEIDAASNRGIENIRELRENVNYVPAKCRYKIYIIDEAHMLTLESFNALLKTLEEPPPYVKFIFATTDPHKIPPTIISRCQRYDFLRISIKKMADFLETVVKKEKLELSRKAIEMICRNSVGGMRDALTAIDQILSFTGTSATDQKVAQILGILDSESRFAFIEALLEKKDGEAISYFQKLQEHGHDVNDVLSDLLQTIKTIALVRTLGMNQALFQDIPADDLETFSTLSKIVSADELQQIFHILLELEEQMKRSAHTMICFEMAILQIASIESLVGLPEIISEIQNIRKSKSAGNSNTENTDSVIEGPAELSGPEKDNSGANQQNSFLNMSEANKPLTDATVIKNILKSDKTESATVEPAKLNKSSPEPKMSEKQQSVTNQDNYSHVDEEKPYVAETEVSQVKAEQTENADKEMSLEAQNNINQNQEIVKLSANKNIEETSMEPPEEWCNFSEEVQKLSSKLASFVRNAVPHNLTGSQLILSFKSGNYASMLTDDNRELLEKIASDWTGHSVHVSCEITPTSASQLTIVEHEQILLERKNELKRKNARAFPQVKDILSVFTNSRITNIELSDA